MGVEISLGAGGGGNCLHLSSVKHITKYRDFVSEVTTD